MNDPINAEPAAEVSETQGELFGAGLDLSAIDVAQVASFASLLLPVLAKRAATSETPWDDVVYEAVSTLLDSPKFIAKLQFALDSGKKV